MTTSTREKRPDPASARCSALRWFSALSLFAGTEACTGVIEGAGEPASGGAATVGQGGLSGGTSETDHGGAFATQGGSSAGTAASGGDTAPGASTGGIGTGGAAGGGRAPGFRCASGIVEPGPAPLLRLSRLQYLNTVRDLVGDVPNLAEAFPTVSEPSSFGLQQADVAQVELEQYQSAASTIAALVAGNATKLSALAPCAAGADKRDCAANFVRKFGARAYRAPVTDAADVENHLALYEAGAKTSHERGLELLIRGMLQSPRFLYRVELGTSEKVGDRAVKLSPYELAARLSYALWDTLPDDALTSAASSGSLASKTDATAQLARMLADPRGATLVRRFLERFIHLASVDALVKDGAAYPDWSSANLRSALKAQASAFFDDVLAKQQGSWSSLLTFSKVFTNQKLQAYYGASTSSAFLAIDWNSSVTSGLLTLPALLALGAKPNESSPIYRGRFVRESLFCQQLPAPPPDVPRAPDVSPGVSTRERLRQHEVNPACQGCHTLIDPIGFGFENFDAIGRYRTSDGGAPVDARGEISGTGEIDGPFDGVVELGQKLAQSALVKECVTRQWFRFMLQRFEQDADGCSMLAISSAFLASDASLNSLPKALVESDAFLYRRPL